MSILSLRHLSDSTEHAGIKNPKAFATFRVTNRRYDYLARSYAIHNAKYIPQQKFITKKINILVQCCGSGSGSETFVYLDPDPK